VVGSRYLRTAKLLGVVVLFLTFAMAFGHVPLALFLGSFMRPQTGRPPPITPGNRPPAVTGAAFSFAAIGVYFLFATIAYVVGGILVASGKLFKLANLGLIILAVIDEVLLIYTRSMPNIFFQRAVPCSWEWFPLGTIQIFIGQAVIILLCAILLYKPRFLEARNH
jgi:hypothetical protein